ncbi:MAG TPA: COX15/CtaA family protein [Rubricoccaceae bacterium]|jgi:heme A synthase|nr:COX15/CtaA family protein [Rubricoccaceae bacterium]
MLRDRHRFRRLAWGALAYTLLVILWGGYVRASGSGAGCGAHWPLCNGEVVPRSATAETLIELTHRVTSGLALPLVLVLLAWAFRAFPKGSPVRKGAAFVVAFMVLEAAVGAGLVLFEQVAYNASIGRAYWMASHLVNTFLLLGALTLTAHAARGGAMPRLRGSGRRGPLVGGALLGLLVLGASGAVTALGDTLALGGGLDPAEEPVVATLVGLRLYHPLLACLVVGLFAWAVYHVRRADPGGPAAFLGLVTLALMLVQLAVGLVNVQLRAPIPLQLVHLLVTDLIWIGAVLFAAEALGAGQYTRRPLRASTA